MIVGVIEGVGDGDWVAVGNAVAVSVELDVKVGESTGVTVALLVGVEIARVIVAVSRVGWSAGVQPENPTEQIMNNLASHKHARFKGRFTQLFMQVIRLLPYPGVTVKKV